MFFWFLNGRLSDVWWRHGSLNIQFTGIFGPDAASWCLLSDFSSKSICGEFLSFIISPHYNDETQQMKFGFHSAKHRSNPFRHYTFILCAFILFSSDSRSCCRLLAVKCFFSKCVFVCWLVELCKETVFISSKARLSFLPEETMIFHHFCLFTLCFSSDLDTEERLTFFLLFSDSLYRKTETFWFFLVFFSLWS